MERDYGFMPPFMDFGFSNNNSDTNDMCKDPLLNPMLQYEQACSYYRYLCLQIDYKIKCKEYEKMCSNSNEKNARVQ